MTLLALFIIGLFVGVCASAVYLWVCATEPNRRFEREIIEPIENEVRKDTYAGAICRRTGEQIRYCNCGICTLLRSELKIK